MSIFLHDNLDNMLLFTANKKYKRHGKKKGVMDFNFINPLKNPNPDIIALKQHKPIRLLIGQSRGVKGPSTLITKSLPYCK